MVAAEEQAVAARGAQLWQFDAQQRQPVRRCYSPLGGGGRNISLCLVNLIRSGRSSLRPNV